MDCPRDNIVMFKKKTESLKEFVQKIKASRFSGMQVNLAQLDEKAPEISAETSEMISDAAKK